MPTDKPHLPDPGHADRHAGPVRPRTNQLTVQTVPYLTIPTDEPNPVTPRRADGEAGEEKSRNLMTAWLSKHLADKMSEEEIAALADKSFEEAFKDAEEQSSTTFKADGIGLYIEGRQVKAMLKEAGGRLGFSKAAKGERPSLRQDLHEALHVDEDEIYLTRDGVLLTQPDGYDTRPIDVMTAQGPRTSIKRSAYVERPTVEFTVRVLKNVNVKEQHLMEMLAFAQDLGLGADRSQGNGKFTVVGFERIS